MVREELGTAQRTPFVLEAGDAMWLLPFSYVVISFPLYGQAERRGGYAKWNTTTSDPEKCLTFLSFFSLTESCSPPPLCLSLSCLSADRRVSLTLHEIRSITDIMSRVIYPQGEEHWALIKLANPFYWFTLQLPGPFWPHPSHPQNIPPALPLHRNNTTPWHTVEPTQANLNPAQINEIGLFSSMLNNITGNAVAEIRHFLFFSSSICLLLLLLSDLWSEET